MTCIMRSPAALVTGLVLAIIILPCIGCGGVGKTPEDIFERAKTSAEAKDYKTYADCFTPETQDGLAGAMILSSVVLFELKNMPELPEMPNMPGAAQVPDFEAMLAAVPDIEATLESHNVAIDDLPQGGGLLAMLGGGGTKTEVDAIVDGIVNKPAFIGDMMAVLSVVEPEGQGVASLFSGDLTEVVINEDQATGKITNLPNDAEVPIEFHKTSDGWRLHLPMMAL